MTEDRTEQKTMEQPQKKEFEAKAPDYTSDGVAVWERLDKNGNTYLSIKIVGHNTIYAFKNIPKVAEQ